MKTGIIFDSSHVSRDVLKKQSDLENNLKEDSHDSRDSSFRDSYKQRIPPGDHLGNQTDSVIEAELSDILREYIEKDIMLSQRDGTPIHVDEVASRLAKIYETIRKIVDWQEDNVLRRGAIERILKRLLFTKVSGLTINRKLNLDEIAETVVLELVRGGHLPNDEIPREVILVVSGALSKYLFFLEQSSSTSTSPFDIKNNFNFTTFVIEIAACEIEEIVINPIKEYALIDAMTNAMLKRIKIIPNDSLSDKEKQRQTFIAVCRTLYSLDDSFISYRLLNFQYSGWRNPENQILSQRFNDVVIFWQHSTEFLSHPQSKDFNRICDQADTVFTLIGDLLEDLKDKPKNITALVKNKKKFRSEVGKLYEKRHLSLKRRLFRLGIFSTLSVFLSNWFTLFIVEVPLANFFYEGFNLFTIFIDFLIPTLVMFMLVIIIRPPGEKNKALVLDTIESFVYKDEKKRFYEIHTQERNRPILKTIFVSLYVLMTWLVFIVVGVTFYLFELPITSVIFDTFTIALTVFAAVVIRGKSKELNVDERSTFYEFALDMISVPVAKVGSFFAAKWKEYNVVAIFLNFVVETPFALVLDTVEGWSHFLKDRKAEIR